MANEQFIREKEQLIVQARRAVQDVREALQLQMKNSPAEVGDVLLDAYSTVYSVIRELYSECDKTLNKDTCTITPHELYRHFVQYRLKRPQSDYWFSFVVAVRDFVSCWHGTEELEFNISAKQMDVIVNNMLMCRVEFEEEEECIKINTLAGTFKFHQVGFVEE